MQPAAAVAPPASVEPAGDKFALEEGEVTLFEDLDGLSFKPRRVRGYASKRESRWGSHLNQTREPPLGITAVVRKDVDFDCCFCGGAYATAGITDGMQIG